MVAVYSPSKGFFIGCEEGGFGGVEGDPVFSTDPKQAINLRHSTDKGMSAERVAARHLDYIRHQTPDAFAVEAGRDDLLDVAKLLEVHRS